MKKILLVLAVIFIAGPVFAQEGWDGERKIAVSFSPTPLVIGMWLGGFGINAGIEFAPVRMFSIKANGYYIGFNPAKFFGSDGEGVDTIISLIRLNMEGRWYPNSNYVNGFFVNAGFQFHRLSAGIMVNNYHAGTGLNTLGIYGGLGYKAVFGKERVAFALEPWIDLVWPLSSEVLDEMDVASANFFGWVLGIKGVRAGLLFGIAF